MTSADDSDFDIVNDENLELNSNSDSGEAQIIVEKVRAKKRKRNRATWKQVVRKRNLQRGLPYISTTGRAVPARTNYDCQCKNTCTNKFTDNEKYCIINNFHNLAEKNIQDAYLFGLITVNSIAR